MQRLIVVAAISLIFVVFYYYTPLRNIIAPEKGTTKSSLLGKKASKEESQFDELRIELYAISNRLTNLQGKIQLLKIAQEHRDWYKEEEYAQLPLLLAKAEEDLKQAEQEYEKIKDRYARETVSSMVKEFLTKEPKGKDDAQD